MAKMTKQVAEKMLGEADRSKQFYCQDGRYFKSLAELESGLKTMTDQTFRSHCGGEKSDFSNWVRDVIGDDKLSRDLLKSTSRAQAAKNVAARIAWLRSKPRRKTARTCGR